jgi:NADH:ubiquinone oxidoreductase subunit 6 (subunit J)
MSQFVPTAVLWALALVAISGALVTVFVREVMRMVLGLGGFLLALAGLFAYFGFGFLALAELFVYVGGVLILILFAIMLVHRSESGSPDLALRDLFVPGFAAVCASLLLGFMLFPVTGLMGSIAPPEHADSLGKALTGPLLSQFETAGVLLLIGLVAVVLVGGGDRE